MLQGIHKPDKTTEEQKDGKNWNRLKERIHLFHETRKQEKV